MLLRYAHSWKRRAGGRPTPGLPRVTGSVDLSGERLKIAAERTAKTTTARGEDLLRFLLQLFVEGLAERLE